MNLTTPARLDRVSVHAVAQAADAQRSFAGQGAADLDFFQPQLFDLAADLRRDHLVLADDAFVRDGVDDILAADAAVDGFGQFDFDLFPAVDHAFGDALRGAAILDGHHHVLRHVGQLAGKVARVGGLEGRIGQAFAGPVRRAEVLQHAQAFAEVGLDRRFDDFPGGLGHQAAHAGQLADLFDAAPGPGVGHQVHGVDVAAAAAVVGLHGVHHFRGDLFAGVGPGVQHLVVAFLFGDHAAVVQLFELENLLFRLGDVLGFGIGRDQVVGGEGQAAERALGEADLVEIVQQVDGGLASQPLVAVGDHRGQFAGPHGDIVIVHPPGQGHVEQDAADGGFDQAAGPGVFILGLQFSARRQFDLDPGMEFDLAQGVGQIGFFHRGENHPLAAAAGQFERHVVAAHDDILRGAHDGLAVGRAEDVVGGHHQGMGFDLGLDRQRQMDGHLVAVEVGIEALADQRVQVDGVALDQHRFEGLDAHAVQGGGPVEQHGVVLDHGFQDVPDLLVLAFQHLLGAFDGIGVAEFLELADDERLVKFQGDLLGQTALVQFQLGTDHDHAAGGVIHAFAQQVLAEAALLALDHVRQRLQRPVAAAQHGPLAAVVVEQRVDGLLQHAFFVADDHLGRIQVDQFAEAVVAVDNAAVQVVEVAGGEVAGVQEDQRPQVRRNHRDHVQHHPFGLVVAVADGLHDFQAVDQVFLLLFGVGLHQIDAQFVRQGDQVQAHQQFPDRFGAHVRFEGAVAPLIAGFAEFLFREQLLAFQVGILGVDHHVVLEIDDFFQAGGFHVQQVAQAAGHGLEEPDVDHGGGQFDVPHPLAAHAGMGDFDAAAVADHALVLHAAVLAAGAFPVLFGAENPLAEQAVLLRTVGPVVDGFRLLHLAKRPTANVVRPRQADLDRRVIVDPIVGGFADRHEPVLLFRKVVPGTVA